MPAIDRRARVVGVGEHRRGDLASWPVRVAAIEQLVGAGRKVILLCDNMDFYVCGLRRERPTSAWSRQRSDGDTTTTSEETDAEPADHREFFPSLMPFADRTEVHLESVKRIRELVGRDIYGIDPQELEFPTLGSVEHLRSQDIFTSLQKARWAAAPSDARLREAVRAELNAETTLSFLKDSTLHRDGAVVVLFALNRQLAWSGAATEGSMLREALGEGGYVSIGTCCALDDERGAGGDPIGHDHWLAAQGAPRPACRGERRLVAAE